MEQSTLNTPPYKYEAPAVFQAGGKRSLFVIILLWISIGVQLIELPLNLVWPPQIGSTFTPASLAGMLFAPVGLGLIVAQAIWFFNSYRNIVTFPVTGRKFSPLWAVLGLIIPLANLLLPYLVVREIWKASTPGIGLADRTAWRAAAVAPIITGWWLATLLAALAGIAFGGILGASSFLVSSKMGEALVSPLQSGLMITVAGILSVTQSLLLIAVIKRIDGRQQARHLELEQARQALD